ncbi:hypothetical protein BJ508DRAFT_313856 [Ascobolus immersus RN42]|uniref:Uncharacterized protein n=1 Tax=Ascobolus immersus RN42 TaxID=1160509 RepID=A0A3N4HKE8_ASCIM|nr:hypothetical protein BJ508DRAFT_313856 [Ascobolus immersus RN42]
MSKRMSNKGKGWIRADDRGTGSVRRTERPDTRGGARQLSRDRIRKEEREAVREAGSERRSKKAFERPDPRGGARRRLRGRIREEKREGFRESGFKSAMASRKRIREGVLDATRQARSRI